MLMVNVFVSAKGSVQNVVRATLAAERPESEPPEPMVDVGRRFFAPSGVV